MAVKLVLLSFLCGLVHGFAGFVFSPPHAPLAPKSEPDLRWRGRSMAEKLREVGLSETFRRDPLH